MSENNSENKKKSSFRDVILIVGIVVVCFALTVYAIYYLFGVAMKPQDEFATLEERPATKEVTDPLVDNAPISITDNVTETLPSSGSTVSTIPTAEPEPVVIKHAEKPKATQPEAKKDEPKKTVEKPKATQPDNKKATEKPKATTQPAKKTEVAKAEQPKVYSEKVDQSSVNKGKFVLQLMALRSETEAYNAMEKYRVACSDIYVVRADLKENGVWFRVRCGITDSMDDALKLKHTLASDYKINADIIKNR